MPVFSTMPADEAKAITDHLLTLKKSFDKKDSEFILFIKKSPRLYHTKQNNQKRPCRPCFHLEKINYFEFFSAVTL